MHSILPARLTKIILPSMSLSQPVGQDSPSSSTSASKGDLWAHLRTLSPLQEAKRLGEGKVPCARKSLLLAMGTSVAISVVGVVAGRGTKSSLNWGVGSFLVVSMVTFESCRRSREAEVVRMRTIIEDYSRRRSRQTGKDVAGAAEAGSVTQ